MRWLHSDRTMMSWNIGDTTSSSHSVTFLVSIASLSQCSIDVVRSLGVLMGKATPFHFLGVSSREETRTRAIFFSSSNASPLVFRMLFWKTFSILLGPLVASDGRSCHPREFVIPSSIHSIHNLFLVALCASAPWFKSFYFVGGLCSAALGKFRTAPPSLRCHGATEERINNGTY